MKRSANKETWDKICRIAQDAIELDNHPRVWRDGSYVVVFHCEQCKIDWGGVIGE